jgi:hypothetical protein
MYPKYLQKHLKTLEKSLQNICNIQMKHLQLICETYMQHRDKHICNIRMMKHLEQTLARYVYRHCNICNISIYFCNIYIKRLQYTTETIETYAWNTRNTPLLLRRMEARRRMEFTGGSRGIATVDQIDSAYRKAGEDPFVDIGILGSMQDTQPLQLAPQPLPPPDLSRMQWI